MAENINEALLNRHTLSGPDEESRAAGQLREDHAQERIGTDTSMAENKPQGSTFNQLESTAKNNQAPIPAAGGASPASSGTAQLLKDSWINLIDSFGGTLIYINIHVFGHSVFGEKVFCQLGEEWIPKNLRSNMESPEVKSMIKKFALLEKMGLITLDLIVLIALLAAITIIVSIVSFMSSNLVGKAVYIFQAITSLGWGGVKAMFDLFST